MKKVALILLCIAGYTVNATAHPGIKQTEDSLVHHRIMLPNGWALTPVGHATTLGDFPLNIAMSHSGKYLAITNNGVSTQSIQLIDATSGKLLATKVIPKAWLGLKFSSNDKYLYASGGNDNVIVQYALQHDSLAVVKQIKTLQQGKKYASPAGLDIDDAHKKLYVVTKEDSSLYIINLKDDKVSKRIHLAAEAYTCLLSPDKRTLFISLWGGSGIAVYDINKGTVTNTIKTGRNPNDLCITKNGKYLFVASSIDNTVAVIDVHANKIIETLNAALYPDAPDGSTTNSVALSTDNKTLYVANADNNCLAVFDVSDPGKSKSKGFIPVGWYPTCVRVSGHRLYVTNGKGFTSLPNPQGPQPMVKKDVTAYKKADGRNSQYIGCLFKGTLSIIDEPKEDMLGMYSKLVYENTPYSKKKELATDGMEGNPIPMKVGDPSPIKHVFYIIKENRTYDQVLGDMPQGNGDTSLVLFGQHITPNEHAIANQFVLLDNFYVDGEVSVDGHSWSMAAYANDFIEKTWPTDYGGRGSSFSYDGKRTIGFPRNGFIWNNAVRHGVTVRNYGEAIDDDDGRKNMKVLAAHSCKRYRGWDLSVLDTTRERVWEEDFDSLVNANAVPQLSVIYLPTDHTSGLAKGAYSPLALVSGNDLAVGLFLEHLSKSPVWKTSAVFILEDDAQNGPDHVDAHRSTAFVAGPYVKRNFVNHSMYSTTGMLRTIELILGLPPMSQYDAAAVPMWRCFTNKPDFAPYHHEEAEVELTERNLAVNDLSKESATFNFAEADQAPDLELNKVLWESIKGKQIPFPGPKRAAFISLHDDDDR